MEYQEKQKIMKYYIYIQVEKFVEWFKNALNKQASDVKVTDRLVDSPAMITSKYSSSVSRVMRMVGGPDQPAAPVRETLEINLRHPLIQGINELRENHEEVARILAEQVYINIFSYMTIVVLMLD